MKKLLFLIIIPLSLTCMDNPFDAFKRIVDESITTCKNIENRDERFEQWKTEYKKLYKLLPNNLEKLELLIQEAKGQNYTEPVGLFLIHWKRKHTPKPTIQQSSKQSGLLKWLSGKKSDKDLTKDIELIYKSSQFIPATTKEFENWVIESAQEYNVMLPYTEFADDIFNDNVAVVLSQSKYPFFKKYHLRGLEATRLLEKPNSIDLHYLSLLPKNFEMTFGNFDGLKLTTLPEDVSMLKNLKVLSLYRNKLIDLPESLAKLELLQELALEGNVFKRLPTVIGKLKLLKILMAPNNQLTEDPHNVISTLSKLKFLKISNNQLTSFEPKSFPPLLISLELNNNQLKKVPPIPQSSQLQYLSLENNPLEESDAHLIDLNHLKKFINHKGNLIKIERLTQKAEEKE